MAITKDPKDPQGLMRALGPGAMGMSSSEENLIGDEPTSNLDPFLKKSDEEGEFLQIVKDLAKKRGEDVPISFLNHLFDELGQSLELSIKKEMSAFANVISPEIQNELISITKLFTMGEEKDRDEAYRRLQKFVDKLGLDLSKYSKAIGENFDKLKDFYDKKQLQLEQEQSLKNDRIDLLKKEQVRLKEQGVITKVNEQYQKLEILTKKEQRIEEKVLREDEKKFIERKERIIREEKDLLKKQSSLTADEDKKIRVGRRYIQSGESSLTNRAESLGVERKEGTKLGRFARGTGAFIRGETGPSAVKNVMGGIYQGLPTTQLKQSIEMINESLLGIPGKVLGPLNTSVKKVGGLFSDKMKDLFTTGFDPLKTKITKELIPALGRMSGGLLRGAAGLLANPAVLAGGALIAGSYALNVGKKKLKTKKGELVERLNEINEEKKEKAIIESEKITPIMEKNQFQESLIKSSREGTLPKVSDLSNLNTSIGSDSKKAPFVYTNAPQNIVNQTNQSTTVTVDVNNPDKTFNIINV
jgi:hypothetical protein